MILDLIKKLMGIILAPILSVLNFPVLPPELVNAVNTLFDYMKMGMGIINFFCPIAAILPAIIVFVGCWTVVNGYHLLMWVLRKIPFVGIE